MAKNFTVGVAVAGTAAGLACITATALSGAETGAVLDMISNHPGVFIGGLADQWVKRM